ncbi:hypothetical protein SGQ44_11515 [Flavobacterium sp. Fl-77]|uniref:Uncharacterized protein n=1 Tax=Flavobacterium flavipigmentatum TaxID=2893884 RepID=A0AAJ2SA50_9FLAO|nr:MULTISPECIES: hypothetical protein [unclassified Flavobacterium]MDX6182939.1 hypothetical protein [Flavobacterium sp. Fl-33]MDX6186392.1 hypothetical protein [Flavobacterium sp. Fl-77]UFH37821.1 hypothetical protein LNP22_13885 [Flavobacterium sp. F-70]
MENQEFYQKSFEIKYSQLVELASSILNFDCVGGYEEVNNETVYYIKLDENINNFKDKSEATAFNEFFKNNFSQYNSDNESKLPYNIITVQRILYFKTPFEALKRLIGAWKEWQIISPELKRNYFEQIKV